MLYFRTDDPGCSRLYRETIHVVDDHGDVPDGDGLVQGRFGESPQVPEKPCRLRRGFAIGNMSRKESLERNVVGSSVSHFNPLIADGFDMDTVCSSFFRKVVRARR